MLDILAVGDAVEMPAVRQIFPSSADALRVLFISALFLVNAVVE